MLKGVQRVVVNKHRNRTLRGQIVDRMLDGMLHLLGREG
jgi:hypothetical protein